MRSALHFPDEDDVASEEQHHVRRATSCPKSRAFACAAGRQRFSGCGKRVDPMAGGRFVVREAVLRLRSGQKVVLSRHERQFQGTVQSFSGDCVDICPESLLYVRLLRPGTRLTARAMTGEGVVEATLRLLACHDQFITVQLVGQPRLLQRRGHPRIPVRLRASLTWLEPGLDVVDKIEGTTQNLSMGGALVRFPSTQNPLPTDRTSTLLGLWLPEGSVSLGGRVLQAWETGVRVRYVDVFPEVADTLRAFIEPRLAPDPVMIS
jgi:hypothetical protein